MRAFLLNTGALHARGAKQEPPRGEGTVPLREAERGKPRSNTMKLGTMKSQLPWSLESADLVFCHTAGLDWDAAEALESMGVGPGQRAQVAGDIETLIAQISAVVRPGDHIVCMSNGGFGGIHAKLLQALK